MRLVLIKSRGCSNIVSDSILVFSFILQVFQLKSVFVDARQFAQRSRVRKLQYIAELERNVQALQASLSKGSKKVIQTCFKLHGQMLLHVGIMS